MDGLGRPLGTLRSQVQLLVVGLLMLLVVSAVGTVLVQHQVASTQHHLRKVLRPAQVAVAQLGEAYADQETGARGYQLTGASVFLRAYDAGDRQASRVYQTLRSELAYDSRSQRLLAETSQAAAAWLSKAATPTIHQPQPGLSRQAALQQALTGQHLFDSLRERLAALTARVNELAAAEVAAINTAQSTANWLTIAAGLVAVALAFAAALILRNSLSVPLTRLVAQVQRVADGDLEHSVDVRGPRELSTVAGAVETMRVRILAQTSRTMEMQRELDLAEEGERIASGLHDVVIRRLSGTGLALQSAASRYPAAGQALSRAVDEIDAAIRALRTVIFDLRVRRDRSGLRKRVLNLVSEREPSLGFTPQLHFGAAVGVSVTGRAADELIDVLRKILSDMGERVSKAEIKINLIDGMLQLQVTDDLPAHGQQRDASALADMTRRAELLGGACTVLQGPGGGTIIDWAVPVAGGEHGSQHTPAE